MKFSPAIILFSILMFSCKKEAKVADNSAPAATATVATSSNTLPALPQSMIDTMIASVDYVDYLWPSMPISTSLEDKKDINLNIGLISTQAQGQIPSHCKALGRKFFNIKGNTYKSADIYFSDGCKFYVFLDGEKSIYANAMTEDAVSFYNAILQAGGVKTVVK
jgi:hypothetical protein